MYIWFLYKTPDLFECPYNTPFSNVHTHVISYEFPNGSAHKTRAEHAVFMQPNVIILSNVYVDKEFVSGNEEALNAIHYQ
jgi:hypothetical protein